MWGTCSGGSEAAAAEAYRVVKRQIGCDRPVCMGERKGVMYSLLACRIAYTTAILSPTEQVAVWYIEHRDIRTGKYLVCSNFIF